MLQLELFNFIAYCNYTLFYKKQDSWNNKCGDNGAFKIRRGTDECGIESTGVNGGTIENSDYQKYLRYN